MPTATAVLPPPPPPVFADRPMRPRKPVWNAGPIGEVINRTPKQVYWLAERGTLPGLKKVGEALVYDPDGVLP